MGCPPFPSQSGEERVVGEDRKGIAFFQKQSLNEKHVKCYPFFAKLSKIILYEEKPPKSP